jgi:hypothetical protein
MDRRRLERIEQYVLGFFKAAGHTRILAQELFDSTTEFANADLVRALEDLEKSSACWCATPRKATTTSH